MVSVFINATLLEAVTKTNKFYVEGDTVCQVFESIEKDFPGFKNRLLTKEKAFERYLMIVGLYKGESQLRVIAEPDDTCPDLEELKILTIACGG